MRAFHARPVGKAYLRASRGRTALALVAWLLVGTGCGRDLPLTSAAELGVTEVDVVLPRCESDDSVGLLLDTVATGLEVPWDVTFLPDGRALFTERPGRIRVIDANGRLDPEPWGEYAVFAVAEAGLLGIDGSVTGDGGVQVFVAATVQDLGSNSLSRIVRGVGRRIARTFDAERGHGSYMEIWRIPEVDGRGGEATSIVDGLPAASVHSGGAVRFGPDGLLYVSSGEAGSPPSAQSMTTTRGKILRYRPDGGVPEANPVAGSPVYALGVRNVQGIGWFSPTGDLLAVEHGPTGQEHEGFRTDEDELNVVRPGANLGWPMVTGATRGGELTSPIVEWATAIAPAGLAVVAEGDGGWPSSAFVTGLRGNTLDRLQLEEGADGLSVRCRESLLRTDWGRLRLVRQAPDGSLWVGTSNMDQRGVPRPGGDVILRLRPSLPTPPRSSEGDPDARGP